MQTKLSELRELNEQTELIEPKVLSEPTELKKSVERVNQHN